MPTNIEHWYDGWFYDRWIAPNQDRLFEQIKELIDPNSRVIDIGCGTGRLAFALADKCESVLGIDLSKRNIERANRNLSVSPDRRVSFEHRSVMEIVSSGKEHFDYAPHQLWASTATALSLPDESGFATPRQAVLPYHRS